MHDATIRIRRTVTVAAALVAAVASSASARIPAELAVSPASAESQAAPARSMADIAARREARATKAWRVANPPRIIEVSSPDDGGFDLASAGIGAAVPLTLILIEVAGRHVLRRRRDIDVGHQPA